jgi:sphinganine-1-phosphate aldolase
MRRKLPARSRAWADIEGEMRVFAKDDVDWRHGRHAFHVWYGGDDIFDVQAKAYTMFMQENGGGAGKTFMSLKLMEDGVIDFAAELLNGPDAVGHITSGGSESIFVAMKAARDWARAKRPLTGTPEVVIPYSGHPTFNRAAEYLGLKITRVPVREDFRADVPAMAEAISDDTIALVGSAVCFPYGVIDPIEELSRLAAERGLWLHVDACVSGYSAPFCRELGYPVPDFDFSLPGVTSMSADLHKYGFCAKGTSSVLYRNAEYQKYQPFTFEDWPLGHFSNPNVASTRPGGSIASAWAVMNYLGREGYLELNERLMGMRQRYIDSINGIEGLHIYGQPHSLIISFGADDPLEIDMAAVADGMLERGWFLGRLRTPPGMLIGLSQPHEGAHNAMIGDLAEVVHEVRASGARGSGGRGVY